MQRPRRTGRPAADTAGGTDQKLVGPGGCKAATRGIGPDESSVVESLGIMAGGEAELAASGVPSAARNGGIIVGGCIQEAAPDARPGGCAAVLRAAANCRLMAAAGVLRTSPDGGIIAAAGVLIAAAHHRVATATGV